MTEQFQPVDSDLERLQVSVAFSLSSRSHSAHMRRERLILTYNDFMTLSEVFRVPVSDRVRSFLRDTGSVGFPHPNPLSSSEPRQIGTFLGRFFQEIATIERRK